MQTLCILGRQPKLGLAELESLYGAKNIEEIGSIGAILSIDPDNINFDRLGGTVKLTKVLNVISSNKWTDIEKYLNDELPLKASTLKPGKLTFGISTYGLKTNVRQLSHTALSIKKKIRSQGRSVRIVPNVDLALGSAKVIYNKLTGALGWEIVIVANGDQTIIAQTLYEQNINAYSFRDRDRPKRDSRVGMLPPKLAQIIINLATGDKNEGLVLDPFCGTGVILQESLLMGYKAEGSDIDQRMIDYSTANIKWLTEHFDIANREVILGVGDASTHIWGNEPQFIASECYLGQAFTEQPNDSDIANNVTNTNLIIKKSLRNIANQIPSGTRLCMAIPAFHTSKGNFKHLPFVDSIEELGYNRVRFEHLSDSDLLYFRDQQIVARELLVITRK